MNKLLFFVALALRCLPACLGNLAAPVKICDVVVVGGGSAGAPIAARLSEDPSLEVILVDAGPDYLNDAGVPHEILSVPYYEIQLRKSNRYVFQYTSEQVPSPYLPPYEFPAVEVPRGKVLGGSSSINGLQYWHGSKLDFDTLCTEHNMSGWCYDDYLPFVKKAEDTVFDGADPAYHGFGGPLKISKFPLDDLTLALKEAAVELGYGQQEDSNAPEVLGFVPHQYNIGDNVRQSTALYLNSTVRERPNFEFMPLTRCIQVLTETHAERRAEGILAMDAQGKMVRIIARKAVVLSAGSIATPQLLMLSGIGPKETLDKFGIPVVLDNAHVGANLQDHYGAFSLYEAAGVLPFEDPEFVAQAYAEYLANGTGPFTTKTFEQGLILLNHFEKKPEADVAITVFDGTFKEELAGKRVFASFLGKPKSRGRVTLTSAHPLESPSIEPGYFSAHEDLDRVVEMYSVVKGVAESKAMKPFLAQEVLPGSTDVEVLSYIASRYVFSSYHWCCTVAMGKVLDNHLRVEPFNNLYVVDASIFPEIPRNSPNGVIIGVGEKAASIIAEDLKA